MLGGMICEGIVILDKENEIVAIVSEELVTVKGSYKYSPMLNRKHSNIQMALNVFIFIVIIILAIYFAH